MFTNSPTWSVYGGGWGDLEGGSTSQTKVPLINEVPATLTLKGCGVKKVANLQQGAQGAVYAAADPDVSGGEGGAANVAVKRLFTQQNEFGRHGLAETVLREVTLLRYMTAKEQQQQQQQGANERGNAATVVDDTARPIRLLRVVEAPHNELCMVVELCALDLRRIVIQKSTAGGTRRCPRLAYSSTIKYLLRRLVRMVHFLHHDCRIAHRDLKLSNVLVTHDGQLRLSDFGSARFIVQGGHDGAAPLEYTPSSHRTTLLYQPLECLYGDRQGTTTVDAWSLGVMFAELVLQKHLFTSGSELAMIGAIQKLLGDTSHSTAVPFSVTAADGPSHEATLTLKFPPSVLPADGLDLLRGLLHTNPAQRLTLEQAAQHPFLVVTDAEEQEGKALWEGKVREVLEKKDEVVKVRMPGLSGGLGLGMGDDDEEGEEEEVVVPLAFGGV